MTESDAVVVHVQLTPEDCVAFQRVTARRLRPQWLEWARAGTWLFYYFMVIVIPVWLGGMDRQSMGLFLMCSVVGLLPLVALLRYVPDVDWSSSGALRPSDMALSSRGVSFKNDVADLKCQWQAFHRVEETPTHFFLYVEKLMAHIVPKRCFGSDEETDRFRAIVRGNIKPADRSA
jgi:hypothetical protein